MKQAADQDSGPSKRDLLRNVALQNSGVLLGGSRDRRPRNSILPRVRVEQGAQGRPPAP